MNETTYVILLAVSGIFMIGAPIALIVILARRFGHWKAAWLAAAGFVVVKIPNTIITQLLQAGWSKWLAPAWPKLAAVLLIAILAGSLAGLFEGFGRYFIIKRWLPEVRDRRSAVVFGAGWGGVESIILGALVLLGAVSLVVLLGESGLVSAALTPSQQAEVAAQITATRDLIANAAWYDTLAGSVERILTITFHIGVTIMTVRAVAEDRRGWLWAAIGLHAAMDALVVVASSYISEVYLVELLPLAGAALAIGLAMSWRPSVHNGVALDEMTAPSGPISSENTADSSAT